MQTKTLSLTRILLLCGAIAGPFFLLTVLIQDYTVPDFNPRLHLLSQLSLGEWGWVQIANFVLAPPLRFWPLEKVTSSSGWNMGAALDWSVWARSYYGRRF